MANPKSLSYPDALARLLEVPNSPRLGLERITGLLERLDNPQTAFKALHVAGTNGKGSTCAFLDSMLAAGGVSRGLTTSPHLSSVRERIQVNGELITEADFCRLESLVNAASGEGKDAATFFERVIAMAFLQFAEAKVDVGVVEVGLGGRLDATNILTPVVAGISTVDLDHEEFLGDSLTEIATEKAGILKKGVPAVVGVQQKEAAQAIAAVAESLDVDLWRVGEEVDIERQMGRVEIIHERRILLEPIKPGLFGRHQSENLALAVGMLERAGLVMDPHVRAAGAGAASWPCRFEIVQSKPLVILDGAHNPGAGKALALALDEDARSKRSRKYVVLGATRGHDTAAFAKAMGHPRKAWATKPRAPRSVAAGEVAVRAAGAGWDVAVVDAPSDALDAAIKVAGTAGVVVVTGSTYLVGELRTRWKPEMPVDPELPDF